jgi:hypothetical protein
VETPSMKLSFPSVILEYKGKERTKSLQLRLIDSPGAKVCNLYLVSAVKELDSPEDPPASLLVCKVEEGTAFQRKEIGYNCRLNIFMSEL